MAKPGWGATRHTHHRVLITHPHPLRLRIADSRTGLSCFVFHCCRARTGLYATFRRVNRRLFLQFLAFCVSSSGAPGGTVGDADRVPGKVQPSARTSIDQCTPRMGCAAVLPRVWGANRDVRQFQMSVWDTTCVPPKRCFHRQQPDARDPSRRALESVRGAAARVCRAPTPPVRVHASWGRRTRCRRGRIMNPSHDRLSE